MRIFKSHPLLKLVNAYIIDSPTPSNLSYQWNFGSLLGSCLVIQIITGVTLAMHYNPSALEAFNSVEHIMRDVNNGWLIRYLHSNTASAFFFIVYLHIGRGLYYGSYKEPRTLVWTVGTVIFIVMILTAFLGYVLPYGQMSLWGATVITNLMSAIPWIGQDIVEFIWGGFSVNNATLNRFFALHFVLPFVLAALALIHLIVLHDSAGSGNPLGVSANCDRLSFAPYFLFKDLITLFLFILILSIFVFFMPNLLGDSENYVVANPMQTPPSIVPEWYLLPFYAVLRSIPNKLIGVIAMFCAIVILLGMPFADLSRSRGIQFKPLNKLGFFLFVGNFLILMKLGAKHVESPFIEFGQFSTVIYFSYFLLLIPVACLSENSLSETYYSITILIKIKRKIGSLIESVRNFIYRTWYNYNRKSYSLSPVLIQSSILPNVNILMAKLLIIPFYIYKGIRKIELFKVIKLSLKDLYNSLSISFILKIVKYSILMRVAIIIFTVLCFYFLALSLITIKFIVTGFVVSSILYSTYKRSRSDVHLWVYNLTRFVPILIFVCILWYIVSLMTPLAVSLFFILGPDFVDSYTIKMDPDWYNYDDPQDPNMGQPAGQPGEPGNPGPYDENTGMYEYEYEYESWEDLRQTTRSPSPVKDITISISESGPGTLYVAAEGDISDEDKLKHVQDVFGEIFSTDRNGNMIHQGGSGALHISNGPLWSSDDGDYHGLVVNEDIAEVEAKNNANYILESDWMSDKSELRNNITLVDGEAVLDYGHKG